jgi:hypothetical protein
MVHTLPKNADNKWLPVWIPPGKKDTGRPRVRWIKEISVEIVKESSGEGNG